jgi:hypothetical protein
VKTLLPVLVLLLLPGSAPAQPDQSAVNIKADMAYLAIRETELAPRPLHHHHARHALPQMGAIAILYTVERRRWTITRDGLI